MRAIQWVGSGADSLIDGNVPAPVLGASEVLVRINAAALNYRDFAIVHGEYGRSFQLPLVLGSDGAGEIVEVGTGVSGLRSGDRVVLSYVLDWLSGDASEEQVRRRLGGPMNGTLAELVAVPAHAVVPLPESLSYEEAATLPVAGVTAYRGLFRTTQLRPGDTVLIHGTGGVATFAIGLAAAAGLRPIVISGSAERLQKARALGASDGIDRTVTPDWESRVLALTGGRGVDLVFDLVGGETLGRSIRATRVGGTVLVIGFLGGMQSTLNLSEVIRRMVRVQGLSVGSREDLDALVRLCATTGFRPVIDRIIDFCDAAETIHAFGEGGQFGKIVVLAPGSEASR